MATTVYIDWVQPLYVALRGSRYKWLDLEALRRRLLPNNDINRIRYFTAMRITWAWGVGRTEQVQPAFGVVSDFGDALGGDSSSIDALGRL
ncbi:MAG: hypothetical protein ACRDVD_06265 [Acidimicrobiia bacterium]